MKRLLIFLAFAGCVGATTSYSNTQGSGDRRSMFRITNASAFNGSHTNSMVDGDTSSNGRWFLSGALSGAVWLKFDFFVPAVVDESKFYEQSNTGQGTWKWQGSNDDSTYTDIGSSFTLGGCGSGTCTQTSLNGNTTKYRWYRLLGVSGSANSGPWCYQFEFQVSDNTDTRSDLIVVPVGTHYVRVIASNVGTSGNSIADVISFKVNSSEQVTNGGVETNTTSWTSLTADAVVRSLYSGISLSPPGACGVAFLDKQRGDQTTTGAYQLIDISGLTLTQQIDMAAYTGGTTTNYDAAAVAFTFEDASNVALDGVLMRPYLAAARSNATAVILRSYTIGAAVSTKGSAVYSRLTCPPRW